MSEGRQERRPAAGGQNACGRRLRGRDPGKSRSRGGERRRRHACCSRVHVRRRVHPDPRPIEKVAMEYGRRGERHRRLGPGATQVKGRLKIGERRPGERASGWARGERRKQSCITSVHSTLRGFLLTGGFQILQGSEDNGLITVFKILLF